VTTDGKPSEGFFFSFFFYALFIFYFSYDNLAISTTAMKTATTTTTTIHIININTTLTSTNPQATQRVETAMAAAAGARDELLVCFFSVLCYYANVFFSQWLGINEGSRRDASQALRYVFFSLLYIFKLY
jgi:hypothetical protein